MEWGEPSEEVGTPAEPEVLPAEATCPETTEELQRLKMEQEVKGQMAACGMRDETRGPLGSRQPEWTAVDPTIEVKMLTGLELSLPCVLVSLQRAVLVFVVEPRSKT